MQLRPMLGLAFQDRPRIRAGKMASALRGRGWEFDVLGLQYPAVYEGAYRSITADPYLTHASMLAFAEQHHADLLLVNNEPNWPVGVWREAAGGRPLVLDVADIQSQRPSGFVDPYEAQAFDLADAYVFVTEGQHEWAVDRRLVDPEKPYAVLSNNALAREMIESTPLSHLGGLVYQGGLDMRSARCGWRDLSGLADAMNGQLHLYGDSVDYGISHGTELEYSLLIHRLARHDWGFVGSPVPSIAWNMTLPNKIYEYFAAGIPVVVMNAAQCRPFCDEGMGAYCETVEQVADWVRTVDPAPYRRAVIERRGELTMEAHIGPLAQMLASLVGAES
ncbi:MAG: hypothetical protein WCJ13_10385 [Coriobacteriia bacterium]